MRDGGDGNESGKRPSPRGQSLIIQKCRHSLQICRSVSIIDTNHDHIYIMPANWIEDFFLNKSIF